MAVFEIQTQLCTQFMEVWLAQQFHRWGLVQGAVGGSVSRQFSLSSCPSKSHAEATASEQPLGGRPHSTPLYLHKPTKYVKENRLEGMFHRESEQLSGQGERSEKSVGFFLTVKCPYWLFVWFHCLRDTLSRALPPIPCPPKCSGRHPIMSGLRSFMEF